MQTLYEYVEREAFIANKTMKQVAKEIGVSHVTLFHIKQKRPSQATYSKMAKYFNKNLQELMQLPITNDNKN